MEEGPLTNPIELELYPAASFVLVCNDRPGGNRLEFITTLVTARSQGGEEARTLDDVEADSNHRF